MKKETLPKRVDFFEPVVYVKCGGNFKSLVYIIGIGWLLVLILLLSSCTKQHPCWTCERNVNVEGIHYGDTTVCNSDTMPQFVTGNGNSISSYCHQ